MAAYGDQVNFHKQLKDYGVVVVPCTPNEKLEKVRKDLDNAMLHFPEFFKTPMRRVFGSEGVIDYSMDKCGHLTNPSAFHAGVVRKIRQWAMASLVPELWCGYVAEYAKKCKLQQGFGHLVCGYDVDVSQYAENHDVHGAQEGDEFFCGFINLDNTSVAFHANNTKCVIPPGHIVVIDCKRASNVGLRVETQVGLVRRLDLCWRLTKAENDLCAPINRHALETMLHNGAPMPVMFSHETPFSEKEDKPNVYECLEDSIQRAYKETGEHISMAYYGLNPKLNYTTNEVNMHVPRTSWEVLEAGKDTGRVRVKL